MAFSLAPHRNLIAVGIVAVAVLASTVIAVHNTQSDTSGSGIVENSTGSQDLLQISGGEDAVDASGTPEWQKALLAGIYGTSSAQGTAGNATLAGSSTVPNTLTDALTQDLLSQFASMQDSGDLSTDDEQTIVNNLLSNYDPANQQPVFGLKDIIISSDTSPEAIKKYANTYALIEQTRIGLMVNALKGKPDAQLISDAYVQIAADLKQVAVPAPIANLHLAAINNYEQIASSLTDVVNYQADPTQGLFALKQYQTATDERVSLYTEFATYFQQNGILFGENEPGYAWTAFENASQGVQS